MWVIFSISAAFLWAVVNIIDKYVLTKWVKNPFVPIIIGDVIGLLISFFIYFFIGFSHLSYLNIALAFIAGIFYILAILFYFKAAKIEEISRIIPLFSLAPLFVLILATIFLGEIFTPMKYLGIFILIIGAILISSKNFIKISFGRAFWFIMLSSLAISVNSVISKYLLNFADFWTIFSYTRIGTIFALVPIFYFNFQDLLFTLKKQGKKVVGLISLAGLLNLIAVLFITIAFSVGYVTLVNALSQVQPFFVLFFATILSIFYPNVLKEEVGKLTIVFKFIATILLFIGAILIT